MATSTRPKDVTPPESDPIIDEPDQHGNVDDTTSPQNPDGWDQSATRVEPGTLAQICDGTGEPTGAVVLVAGYTDAGHPLVVDLPPAREIQNGVAAL
jgi:hypothetical protein